jgi:hypothetical protein
MQSTPSRAVVWLLPFLFSISLPLLAQDSFEIQVYEYETVPKGRWNLETHLNYIGRGSKEPEGTVAPTNNQTHMTYELTHGITDYFELAWYLVLARRPGMDTPMEYAGTRLRPRVRLPESWHLPMKTSISFEFGFPTKKYEENSSTFELRPILERNFGRMQLDLNPTVVRALKGPGTAEGWEFEPALRLAYALTKRFEPSLEYYGATGPLTGFHKLDEQVHLLYPGWDFKLTQDLVWNFGIGWATTPAGSKLTYKMRLGWEFGPKSH